MKQLDQPTQKIRGYIEAPAKPANFDFQVMQITGGRGKVVWGMDARCFRNGDPQAIKYPKSKFGLDRWIFETLNEPFCSETEWEAARYKYFDDPGVTVDMFGPYPRQGIWGMKMILQDPWTMDYMPCSEDFLTWLRMNHQAWESGPVAAYASLANYNRMMEQMAQEKAEDEAATALRVDDHIAWARAHADEINAADTRATFLVTPDGQPWKRETANVQ